MAARNSSRRKAGASRKSSPRPVYAELLDVITRLSLAEAAAYTAAAALSAQAADADTDIAVLLRFHVAGELSDQLARLKDLREHTRPKSTPAEKSGVRS